MALTFWHYEKCSTCRKAKKWLDDHGVAYQAKSIVDDPPSKSTLAKVLKQSGEAEGKLFNTSGQSYRNGGYKTKLPQMSTSEKLAALTADGKLIKRPILFGDGVALVGFREAAYEDALG